MPSSPILEVRGVTRRYRDRAIVADASLSLQPGGIGCLLGPSGCGKSTLLRMIAGLESVDEGTISIRGRAMSTPSGIVAPEDRGVGLVFQDSAPFPHLDVSANIAFGLKGMAAAERRARAASLLARFHIEHLAEAWPHTLSGGEQQRVAIARALAREPSLLLLDEPFSGLDAHLKVRIRQTLLADLRASGATVLIVTHDPEEAMLIADELFLMSAGRVLQTGSAATCYNHPASMAAARLLGDVVTLVAEVRAGVAVTPLGVVPAPTLPDGPAEAMIRPEMLRIVPTGWMAEVAAVRFAGPTSVVELTVDDQAITIRTTNPGLAVGSRIGLSADLTAIRVYAAGG